jgi:Zn-dependent protease/CBS domain-containing protein
MQGSVPIARVGGIQVRIHFTLLLVLPLIAIGFARELVDFRFATELAGVPTELVGGSPLFWGMMVALALFGSVFLHELAHAWVAIRKGGKVRDITLLMIGGVANIEELPGEPKHEALMALVGPLTSIALAGVLYLIHLILGQTTLFSLQFALFYLAWMNLALGLFNLLPAFPMDGGRVLRGLLVTKLGAVRATQWAANLGKAFALLFFLVSFLTLNFFLMIIAFFIYVGAEAEAGQVLAKSILGEVRVTDLLRPAPTPLAPAATVEDAAARMLRDKQSALVVSRGDDILGLVTLDDLAKIAPERRVNLLVSEIVRPAPPVPPSASAWDALRLMGERRLPLLPVVDGGRLVGVLNREDAVRALRLYQIQPQGPPPIAHRERMA